MNGLTNPLPDLVYGISAQDGLKYFTIEPGVGISNIFDYSDRRPDASHLASLTPGRTFYVSLLLRFKK